MNLYHNEDNTDILENYKNWKKYKGAIDSKSLIHIY